MTRPTLEVADILRAHGDRFLDRYRSSFDFQQLKAFRAIQRCRTIFSSTQVSCPRRFRSRLATMHELDRLLPRLLVTDLLNAI